MPDALREQITSLYAMLVESFATARQDLEPHIDRCRELAMDIVGMVDTGRWDDQIVDRCLSVIVLLDHVGAPREATQLLWTCQMAAGPVAQVRFASVELLLRTRRGELVNGLPSPTDVLPSAVEARLRANRVLSGRYDSLDHGGDPAAYLRQPAFPGGSVAHFALTSLAFDHAVFAARLPDARVALGRMEQLTVSIMSELGDDHPYLGLVLLTLSSAKCSLAAVDGNIQDLRRYADVLAIAVQRASAQLGTDHPHTIGGMANLAHIEFEIALASGSPVEVAQCLDNLEWLELHSWRVLQDDHPIIVILAINAAVAELEAARQARSVERIEEAKVSLEHVAELVEQRFGQLHPCTAIARSNAASAGFDLARALRSRPQLEHVAEVLEDAVSKVSSSLGAGHATARALTRQLRACRRLLASDNPWTDDRGGGTGTIVKTIEDEMWGLDDDYVPVYEASRAASVPVTSSEAEILAAIDATTKYFNDGDIVEGIVVAVSRDEVLLEIGYEAEGVIPASELSIKRDVDPADVVSVGDQVEALVLQKEDKEGRVLLSKKRADFARAWDGLERARDADESVTGTVIEAVKGGLILDIGVRGFLPASLVETRRVRDLQPYVGRELEAMIIELDKNRNNVVLSRRAWLEQTRSTAHRDLLGQLSKSQVRKGVVSSIVDFGAFVNLGGVDGLVHVSELSWTHIDHPSEVVEVGQEVTVEVLEVDMDRERVSLSLKATQEDPWRRFARLHGIGQFVPGKVTKLVPFGAFVRLDEGIEGLLHISELAERHVETAEEVVQAGNDVVVKVVDIDLQRRRVQLSLRQANEKFIPEEEFDPTQYGMPAEYDPEGNYIYPEGFDPVAEDWIEGYERQRDEWESEYAKAQALYERHMSQVRPATAEAGRAPDGGAMPVARESPDGGFGEPRMAAHPEEGP